MSPAGSAFTASDNLSLSSWVTTTSGFSGFQHPQSLSAMGTTTASLPHPIQGSLPPYSRLGMPLTPTALAGTMQGSGPSFPSFHMPRYHHYFQQGPYAAIQGLRHSSTVMTPFVWLRCGEEVAEPQSDAHPQSSATSDYLEPAHHSFSSYRSLWSL